MKKLKGTVIAKKSIAGQIVSTKRILGKVGMSSKVHDKYPDYSGIYSVTPKIDAQILDTDYRSLTQDIEILAIPVMRVENPSGGETITIAFD